MNMKKIPTIQFADTASKQKWTKFAELNPGPNGYAVTSYAHTLILVMQGLLEQKKNATIHEVVTSAIAEVHSGNLSTEQKKCAMTLISACWIHGKDFASCVAA